MCQRSFFSRSCSRIAEEAQLRAEEEFLVEALKRIKQQRNCLQIERLHLESLKVQLQNSGNCVDDEEQSNEQGHTKKSKKPAHKPTELKSAVDLMHLGSTLHKDDCANMDEDVQCNNQELNLNPTSSSSNTLKPSYSQYASYSHSDDGSSSDASDGDDVMIDINMLMNGSTGHN